MKQQTAFSSLTLALGLALSACNLVDRTPVTPEGQTNELSTAAAYEQARWVEVKRFYFNFDFVVRNEVTVNANQTIVSFTEGISGSTDPKLVAFYRTTGNRDASPVKIVALNDNNGADKNPRISWTNNTGAAVSVQVVAYAEAGATGNGTLRVRVGSGIWYADKGQVRGLMAGRINRDALLPLPDNCSGVIRSRTRMENRFGGGYYSAMLAVNAQTMTGAYISEYDATVSLADGYSQAPGDFYLGFMPSTSMEPLMDLTSYWVIQENLTGCN